MKRGDAWSHTPPRIDKPSISSVHNRRSFVDVEAAFQDELLQQRRRTGVHLEQRERLAFLLLKEGLGALLVHRVLQIVEAPELVNVRFRQVERSHGGKKLAVYAERLDDPLDLGVFRLTGIRRDVIPQRHAVFQGGVPSLDVVEEQLGEALVVLAQGRERSVELLARGGEPLVILLKAFQPLLEVRVHVVAVYEPRVDQLYTECK